MIVTSDNENVKQAESAPQFTANMPHLNPLAAASSIAITKHADGITLEFVPDREKSDLVRGSGTIADKMIARSEKEVARRPKSAKAHTTLGIALLNAGDVNSAQAEFEAALSIDPVHYVAALNLARTRIEQGRFEDAERIYFHLKEHYPQDPTPVLSLANMAIRKGQYDVAARMLRDAIGLGHKAITAKHLLGLMLLKLGRNREAISILRLAAHLEVRSPALYEALGVAYNVEGDYRRAVVALKTSLSLNPGAQDATRGLAFALLELKQTDEATNLLVGYLERNPQDYAAKQLLARAYAARRQYRSAIAQLTQVWSDIDEIDEKDSTMLSLRVNLANNIGAYYLENCEIQQAELWFGRSISIGPNVSPIPYNNLARVSLRKRAADAAFEILRRAKDRFGDNPDTLFMLSVCYYQVGLYDTAIAQISGLVESGKATPEIQCFLSSVFFEGKGDYETGMRIAKDAFKRFRDNDVAANMLAYAYLLMGDPVAARPIIEAHIEKDDEHWTHPSTRVTFTATYGLLRITEGDLKEGTRLYRKAEKMCSQLGLKELARVVVQKMNLELARAYIRNRDFESATEKVREGLAIRDGNLQYEQHLQALEKRLLGG